MGQVIDFAKALFNRARFFGFTGGTQMGGKRDLYATFGYVLNPNFQDYLNLYLRDSITKRIIEEPVKATWTAPPVFDEGKSKLGKAFISLCKKNSVFYHFTRADIFCGLGQMSVIVVGFNDGGKLDQPVRAGKASAINYMQAYMEPNITIVEFDDDQTSERFGLPVMYAISPGEVVANRTSLTAQVNLRQTFKVHYTRILHVVDNCLENTVLGHSRLESLINTLWDLQKVSGGSAETFWLTGNRGLHVDVDKEVEMDPEDAASLADEVNEYQSELRRVIRTRGVTIKNLGSDVADPRGNFDMILSLISANTGIPKRVLMGAEAGQLASQQDRANWAIQIAEREVDFAEPVMLKPFVQMCQYAGVLPDTPYEDLTVEWPDAFMMNPLEMAQAGAQVARSMANSVAALAQSRQQVGETVFSIPEVRRAVMFGRKFPQLPPKPDQELSKIGEGTLDNPELQLEMAQSKGFGNSAQGGKNNDSPGKGQAQGSGENGNAA